MMYGSHTKLPVSFVLVVVLYLINFTSLLLLADNQPPYSSFMAFLEVLNTTKPQFQLIQNEPVAVKKFTMADLERKQKELFSAKPGSYSYSYVSDDGSFEAIGFSAEPECYYLPVYLPLTTDIVYKYQWVDNSPFETSSVEKPSRHLYILISDFVNENFSNLTKVETIDLLEKAAIVFSDWHGDVITSKSNEKISLSNNSIRIESKNEGFNTQKIEYYFFHKNKLFIVGGLQRFPDELSGIFRAVERVHFSSRTNKFIERVKLK